MKIAFTLCSNNYLAQAKALGDSLIFHNPDYQFIIGLNDKVRKEFDYKKEINHTIIPVDIVGIPDFNSLWQRYNIIELNTCVKPFYIEYLISKFKDLEFLFFFDPDIYIFNKLEIIENEFGNNCSILLTPHILKPISIDNKYPLENLFLNYGIFNLGFIGFKDPSKSISLINWWKERTYKMGFNRPDKGLFVDQIWFNLAIIFFDNIKISKNPGFNVAPWNIHERDIQIVQGKYIINKTYKLVFYHFSTFNYKNPDVFAEYYNRDLGENIDFLKQIYHEYYLHLVRNHVDVFSEIPCEYVNLREEYLRKEAIRISRSSFKEFIKYYAKKTLPLKIIRILNVIRS